jgi:hypothetical protein
LKQVLVVHALSPMLRRTTVEFVLAFGRYAPTDVEVTYHNIRRPIGRAVKGRDFDALFLTYDLLSLRQAPQWTWVMETLAPVVDQAREVYAFPQDDYTYNTVLDESLAQLGTAAIYTPLETGLNIVYPTMYNRAAMRHAHTGYVDEATAQASRSKAIPMPQRRVDVGQRVRMLPPWFGRGGRQKGLFAERFAEVAAGTDLVVDISTREEDVFSGEDWYAFLGSCRATIGQKGGASLCDPDGAIMRSVVEYCEDHPEAGFDEIEQACFPGLDGHVEMSAISPRLFDAAMLGTAQILVEDDYLGVLDPWVHYIPTDQDLTNIDEIAAMMKDIDFLSKIADAATDVLIDSGRYTYRAFVHGVFESVTNGAVAARSVGTDVADDLQWRLTPDLFAAVQRVGYLAWSTRSARMAADLVEKVVDLLDEHPELTSHLDAELLRVFTGDLHVARGFDGLMAPIVDVIVQCYKLGAGRALSYWLRSFDSPTTSEWQLMAWTDADRLLLDEQVIT